MFDLDFVTTHFETAILKPYFDKLREASRSELGIFKQEVKLHKKKSKFIQAFCNTPTLSTHEAIISAINYEILKRKKKGSNLLLTA